MLEERTTVDDMTAVDAPAAVSAELEAAVGTSAPPVDDMDMLSGAAAVLLMTLTTRVGSEGNVQSYPAGQVPGCARLSLIH